MTKTIGDLLGGPESWANNREWRMPFLRGATVVAALEVEPDEVRIAVDAQGRVLHSTFVIADREVRQRLLQILQPGMKLEDCLNHPL